MSNGDAGPGNPWLIAPVVALAAFMEVLDISIANVSLQHIAGSLSASQEESTWVLTSYLVTNAIILPVSGWLSTVLGRKRFFTLCIVGFSASSLLCGLAPSLGMLIAFRALQGLTGGGLQPVAQAILADAFPPAKRGMAFALYGMAVVFAPAIGPTLGGIITDNASWRWVFLINVPVGVVLVSLVAAMVHDGPQAVAEREERMKRGLNIDYLGFGLLVLGLGALQVMLDRGEQLDWFGSSFIVSMAVLSGVSLAAFVLWELGQDDPIVDLRLLKHRNFATANLLMFTLGFILLGSTVLLPELVQRLFGYTATQAGMVLTPGGMSIILVMPIIGRLVGILDARWMIVAGLVLNSVALLRLSGVTLDADYHTFVIDRIIQAMGLSLLFIPISTVSYVGLPPGSSNQSSAIINLSRNLGGSVGISIVTVLLSRGAQQHQVHLVEHVDPASPAYRAWAAQLRALWGTQAGMAPTDAAQHALGQIYGMVQQHATLLAFLEDFRFLAGLFLMAIPLVFLMRKGGGGGAPGAH